MDKLIQRFLRYVQVPTASNGASETCPSTPEQKILGALLAEEMQAMGIADAAMDDNGYVYGTIPSNIEGEQPPVIGFIAHMDVVRDVPWTDIKTRIIRYEGGRLVLNEALGLCLEPGLDEGLEACVGKQLIVTDGTTLLGADNKAGIAEIMAMAQYYIEHPEVPHGTIKIGFTPDEEIGRGANKFDVPGFGADFAYTVDGGPAGELSFETFSAASALVEVKGYNVHPGSAKNKMKNALEIAMQLHGLMPAAQKPQHTEGHEGFIHLNGFTGNPDGASMRYIIRDHDDGLLEEKKAHMQRAADYINSVWGEGTVTLTLRDGYRNMAPVIKQHWHLIENAREAIRRAGVPVLLEPVRGGTDGCKLTYMGLPCPNLGVGGYGFHGKHEFACVEEMQTCVEILKNIVAVYAEKR